MANLNRIGGLHYEIMRKCYNENYIQYKSYGAKGIKVCPEWHDREVFREWAYAHGYVKGKRVLRHDNNGDYCPKNCYIGDSPTETKRKGYNQMIQQRAIANKARKASIGVTRISDHPAYEAYHGMITRCCNPNADNYKYYGERGIKVCDEWLGEDGFYNFVRWSEANGFEQGLTIDRIDNNKGYSPNNCRWVTTEVQERNKRRVHKFYINGELHSATSFCKYRNIDYGKFMRMYKKGMNINRILDELEK